MKVTKEKTEYNEALKAYYSAEGGQMYHIALFGDYLAKQEGYKRHTGIEAVQWFLVQRYKWTPAMVKSLNADDLAFLLAEDMSGWTIHK